MKGRKECLGGEEVTIDREEWVRLKKKGKGPVWSINRSCASHMITNGENG